MVARVRSIKSQPRRAKPEEVDEFRELEDDFHIRELEDALRIDEHALEEALRDQPSMFYRVSKAFALEMSRRDAAKQALADAEARADLDIRDEAREEEARVVGKGKEAATSKIKLTEGEVRARVQLSAEVVIARDALAARFDAVAKLTALKEAFQQRSYALKDLASLYVANYYTASENGAADRASRDLGASETRRRMNAARRSQ